MFGKNPDFFVSKIKVDQNSAKVTVCNQGAPYNGDIQVRLTSPGQPNSLSNDLLDNWPNTRTTTLPGGITCDDLTMGDCSKWTPSSPNCNYFILNASVNMMEDPLPDADPSNNFMVLQQSDFAVSKIWRMEATITRIFAITPTAIAMRRWT